MKLFIAVLVLIFSLQSLTKADDISDFEIEGMSIGDSLLDYYSKEEIIKDDYPFPNKKFATHYGEDVNFETYTGYQVFFLSKDKKYKIHYLSGKILYDDAKDDFNECRKKKNKIINQIKNILKNVEFYDQGVNAHTSDETNKSLVDQGYFTFESGDSITVACTDWSKYMQKEGFYGDNLSVSVRSKIFNEWLNSGKAYEAN